MRSARFGQKRSLKGSVLQPQWPSFASCILCQETPTPDGYFRELKTSEGFWEAFQQRHERTDVSIDCDEDYSPLFDQGKSCIKDTLELQSLWLQMSSLVITINWSSSKTILSYSPVCHPRDKSSKRRDVTISSSLWPVQWVTKTKMIWQVLTAFWPGLSNRFTFLHKFFPRYRDNQFYVI